jgi:hypothetical protein
MNEAALAQCRGHYQRHIVTGAEALSGASLCGRARQYAGRYATSRANLLARLAAAGLRPWVHRGRNGKLTLEFGPVPHSLRPGGTYLGVPLFNAPPAEKKRPTP